MSGEENLREAFQDIAICHLSAEKAKIGTGNVNQLTAGKCLWGKENNVSQQCENNRRHIRNYPSEEGLVSKN